jgi:hypothetical protein
MVSHEVPLQFLLTLPPGMASEFAALETPARPNGSRARIPAAHRSAPAAARPICSSKRGSETGAQKTFSTWLQSSRKLMLHSGGQSRRLPAYAPGGKLLMPVPVFRWSRGQKLDQSLLDLALPDYSRVLAHGGSKTVAMLVSGDTLIRMPAELPAFPDVDVLGLGMWGTPEKAKDFGVFFTPRGNPNELAFFLQKPAPARTRELAQNHLFMFDTGMWLLSERAVQVLLQRCGWDEASAQFTGGRAANYEFYSRFALALGAQPTEHDPLISLAHQRRCAAEPRGFYHFGTSAQMIESVSELQNLILDETKLGTAAVSGIPINICRTPPSPALAPRGKSHALGREQCRARDTWQIAHEHVLTGVPENDWKLSSNPASASTSCPSGKLTSSIRAYGFRDSFSGKLGDANTKWLVGPQVNGSPRAG